MLNVYLKEGNEEKGVSQYISQQCSLTRCRQWTPIKTHKIPSEHRTLLFLLL